MKHLKIIWLALAVAAALMAFAGSATAAPTLTSPAGTAYSGTLTATATPGTSLLLKASFANVTCTESSVSGKNSANTEAHATYAISSLSYSKCGSTDVIPLKNADGTFGTVTINPKTEVFGSNTNVTMKETIFGFHCVYGTTISTKLGTLNPSPNGTTAATLTISATLPYNALSTNNQFVCGATGNWSGSYTVTAPIPLYSN